MIRTSVLNGAVAPPRDLGNRFRECRDPNHVTIVPVYELTSPGDSGKQLGSSVAAIEIEEVSSITPEVVQTIAGLVRQLLPGLGPGQDESFIAHPDDGPAVEFDDGLLTPSILMVLVPSWLRTFNPASVVVAAINSTMTL